MTAHDDQMLTELIRMGEVYAAHGQHEMAEKMKELATQVLDRMNRRTDSGREFDREREA